VTRTDWIGFHAEVLAPAPYAGIAGTVVDETRETLRIASDDRERVVPKRGSTFRVKAPDGSEAVVEGSTIAKRPEDRLRG